MEKFLSHSFPSFCGRTVFSSFPPLFFSTQTVGAPASADRAQAPRRPPSPQPQLLTPPEFHQATITGTATARPGPRASSPVQRQQGRAPRARLGAGRSELPWARDRGLRRRGQAPWVAQLELPPVTAGRAPPVGSAAAGESSLGGTAGTLSANGAARALLADVRHAQALLISFLK